MHVENAMGARLGGLDEIAGNVKSEGGRIFGSGAFDFF